MRMATCHPERKHRAKGLCTQCCDIIRKKMSRDAIRVRPYRAKTDGMATCHPNRKNKSRGECGSCYATRRRSAWLKEYRKLNPIAPRAKAAATCHPDRPMTAKGLCYMCYARAWRATQDASRGGRPKPRGCEVCGSEDHRINWDHNHQTGAFRGWICHDCNLALGMVRDSVPHLKKLIVYLEQDGFGVGPHANRALNEQCQLEVMFQKS